MVQILIRKLEEETLASLEAQAALRGRSLEEEIREILTAAVERHREEVRQQTAALRSRTRRPVEVDLEEQIREDRRR
ncbi:MAG: hypothetical protein KDD47_14810 [Acidobacteria bacterium]|nr:hypothetical protein [Acidobacteriota bacterium]